MKRQRDDNQTKSSEKLPMTPTIPCVDKDGMVENCAENALYVYSFLFSTLRPIALPLRVGAFTLFHISFVPLLPAIPFNVSYFDGSNKGIQINIDRKYSYALPLKTKFTNPESFTRKMNNTISIQDAKQLILFVNTVLTGKDQYKASSEELMHKIMNMNKSSKKEYNAMLNAPDFEGEKE